jgi:hypothetical protein
MPNEFQHDVFLSHSAKDMAVVRPLADRLRKNGLRNDSQPSTAWRLGLGAVGGWHVPVSGPSEQGAPLHSPTARRLQASGRVVVLKLPESS